jgi:hypothetical protein
MLKRLIMVLLSLPLATALATADPKVSAKRSGDAAQQAMVGKDSIAVISYLGNEYSVRTIGFLAFGNKRDAVTVNWDLDGVAAARIAQSLKAQYAVVPVKLSAQGISALKAAPASLFGIGEESRAAHFCTVLRRETQGKPFSYYVLIVPSQSDYSNTNQIVQGIGIVYRQGIDTGYTHLHALYRVEILDGNTCKILRSDAPRGENVGFSAVLHGATREVDRSWMPEPSAVSADARLKAATRELLEQSLSALLRKMFASAQ